MGISKDKEAYEEWEAWEKYDARDGGGCAGTRAGRGVQMAEMDAAQDSWRSGAGSPRVGQHTFMHTHAVPLPAFSEMTIIHYTDLLPECSPTAASAGLSGFHSGLESICPLPPRLQTFSTTDARPLCTFITVLPFIIVFNAAGSGVALTPAHQSAHLQSRSDGSFWSSSKG